MLAREHLRELRDLREGGVWSKPQRFKNDLLFCTAMATIFVVRRLPLAVLRRLGRFAGFLVWLCAPRLRRVAIENVALGLPAVSVADRAAFVRDVYRSLGGLLGDTVVALDPTRSIAPLPFLEGARACLDDAVAEGRGVVFASAHLGPWEQVAMSLVNAGLPLSVVAREPYDPRFGELYRRLRDARGVRTIYRGASGASIKLVRALRTGGVLGVPMDLASRVPSIDVPFLGTMAPTAVGPARLAIRTGAVVVVGTAARSADGSLGIAVTRIAPSSCERELTTRINDELGARIRALPELWPWMHPRWREHRA